MCLFPQLIKNKKYEANKKNGGDIPTVYDKRTLSVPIGCGKCIECRKQKAREWQIRLMEDIKEHKNGKFITLTFSNESITKLNELKIKKKDKESKQLIEQNIKTLEGYDKDNAIATIATRLFLERWRKKYKKSLRHWLVTELGHNGTENIHMHGIIWTNETYQTIKDMWQYGYIWPRPEIKYHTWVNEQTINYIIKYVSKTDIQHKEYKSIVLTSPGIGNNYTNTQNSKNNKFKEDKTDQTYRTKSGHKISLPIYWRNKIYTEEEREKLWIQQLNKEIRYVRGEKISIKNGDENYKKILEWHQRINNEMGYGNNIKDWNREKYEREMRNLMYETRMKKKQTPSARSNQKGMD